MCRLCVQVKVFSCGNALKRTDIATAAELGTVINCQLKNENQLQIKLTGKAAELRNAEARGKKKKKRVSTT